MLRRRKNRLRVQPKMTMVSCDPISATHITGAAMPDPSSALVEMLKAITAAFNAHDLDAIMAFFADECSLDMPRGPEPWGARYVGKAAVREGLAARFKGLPDVHYGDDRHWVCGNLGVSEWLLTGTTPQGVRVRVRGCDHWEFRDGKVIRKDSYWKLVEKPV
jgi:ketosteroid isomerase-like protein